MTIKNLVAEIKSKGLLRAGSSFEELMKKAIEVEEKNAELEQQFAAVVAENSVLKSVDVWMNADEVGGSAADKAIENGATPEEATRAGVQAVIESIETPATDAAIANIQAQGVEGFLTFCGEENSVFVEAKAYYRSLADAVDEFAAQLRQGEKS